MYTIPNMKHFQKIDRGRAAYPPYVPPAKPQPILQACEEFFSHALQKSHFEVK